MLLGTITETPVIFDFDKPMDYAAKEEFASLTESLVKLLSGKPKKRDVDVGQPKRKGLRNGQSACYQNAIIQSLNIDNDFVRFVHETVERFDEKVLESESHATDPTHQFQFERDVIAALSNLFGYLRHDTGGKTTLVDKMHTNVFRDLLKELRRFDSAHRVIADSIWDGSTQQDAAEFFNRIIGYLQILVREINGSDGHGSDAIDLMSFATQSTTNCGACNSKSTVFERGMLTLNLPINTEFANKSVADLLLSYQRPEALVGVDKYQCHSAVCNGTLQDGSQQLSLHGAGPQTLVVQLNRFQTTADGRNYHKLTEKVDISLRLNAFNNDYVLYAVVLHDGDAMSGHYTAMCRTTLDALVAYDARESEMEEQSQWFAADDTNNVALTHRQVQNRLTYKHGTFTPYILFDSRIGGSHRIVTTPRRQRPWVPHQIKRSFEEHKLDDTIYDNYDYDKSWDLYLHHHHHQMEMDPLFGGCGDGPTQRCSEPGLSRLSEPS